MGGSIFLFVESKTFEFSVEEGGSYFMLRIYERFKDSLWSVFLGKESVKRLLTNVEELISNIPPRNFARTFRDGSKVFILQLGSNAHGSFLMISKLLHGCRKGSIIVLEGKLGSGWRGFGFHLRKAIAPDSLTVKPPIQSVLNLIGHQFRQQKSFLSATVDGDRKDFGGSKKGKHLMPGIQNSNLPCLTSQSQDCLSSQYHDSRDRGVGKERKVPGADFMLEINANAGNGIDTPVSLELSLCLECGLNGKWVVKHSNIREVGRGSVEPTQVLRPTILSKPNQLDPSTNFSKPKPNLVWRPKTKELNSLSFLIWSSMLPSVSTTLAIIVLSSGGLGDVPITPLLLSTVADAQFHDSDKVNDARFLLSTLPDLNPASDVVEAELLGSDETDEAKTEPTCTTDTDSEEGLEQDLRLTLQEHSDNIVKKLGNSEQWVLELRDERRVAVLIQISLPRCEAIVVLEEHKQLALVP